MPTPLFNPDHSTSILLENGQNPAIRESYTIAQILNFASTLGCDSVVIKPDFVNYDQTACYYMIYAFNLGTLSEYYVASGDWYDTNPETQSDIFVQSITGITGYYDQSKVITLTNNGLAHSNTVQYNQITTLKTKDGINYLDFNWSIYGRQTDPYIFATNASIDTLYINGDPVIENIWHCVGSIKGSMGVLTLSSIKDEEIGNGGYHAGANLSVIENLAPGSRIDTLVSNIGKNEQTTIIYSGDFYRMDILRTVVSYPVPGTQQAVDISTATLKFYLNPTTGGVENLIYSYAFPFGWDEHGDYVGAIYIGIIIDDENEVAALACIRPDSDTVDYNLPGIGDMTAEQMHNLWTWVKAGWSPDEDEDPLDSFEDNEGDGGGDLINRPHNPIPEPGVPGLSAYDTGFVSQFVIGKTALKSLASFLWSQNFWENVGKFFSDPRQIIQGLVISDVLPGDTTTGQLIKAGGISTGVYGSKINKQFERYDMGSLTIDKRLKTNNKKGGVYFDYSPFTRLKLYLPYCGEHELNCDDCIGKTLSLSYTVDHLSGICCAHLKISGDGDEECHYNYTGQLGVQVPLSAEDFGGFYRAILSAGAALGGALATSATGGMTAPLAVSSAANAIGNIANMGREVDYTSGGGSISGQLSSEYPYITIEEPDPFMATNQKHYTGYPCYSTYKLGDMTGYTKVFSIHLDGLSCNESEREIIKSQLANGVVINADPDPLPTPSSCDELCKIMLLTNLSDPNTIGKKFYKSNGSVAYTEIKSDLLYNQNLTRVGLLINQWENSCNYVYIPTFGRCYYVDSCTVESGAMCRLDLVEDACESFWNELKEVEAIIETTEERGKRKLLVNNNTWFMPQRKNVKTLTFKDNMGNAAHFSRKSVDDGGKMCFIITIAGDTDDPTP